MALDAQRLGRVLGLLSSSHDGEVLNAARAADRIVKEAGLTWAEVAQRIGGAAPAKSAGHQPGPRTRTYERGARPAPKRGAQSHRGVKARELIAYLLNPAIQPRMNPFERSFVASLDRRPKEYGFSENQWRVLWEIGQKVGAIVEPFAA